MAEFQEVVREWQRMCKSFAELCPVGSNPVCGELIEATQKDMEKFETAIMKWAAENPEPEYPTWAEWMIEQGLCGADLGLITRKAYEHIPADIAQKLGLKPRGTDKRGDGMELKSCPFCGCIPIVKSFDMYGEKWFYVMCPACRAEINEPVSSKKEAAQAWNRREKHVW